MERQFQGHKVRTAKSAKRAKDTLLGIALIEVFVLQCDGCRRIKLDEKTTHP